MRNYILYSHAGSKNHGCEALLRTTIMLLKEVEAVYSEDTAADQLYGLNQSVELRPEKTLEPSSRLSTFIYSIRYHLHHSDKLYFQRLYRNFIRDIQPGKIYISIGGDNYCYHFSTWLDVLNEAICKKGSKSVLWGCSINEDEFRDPNIVKDLARYSLITARETMTYRLLKSQLPNSNIQYVPDTAFLLPTVETRLPSGFEPGNTIGINFSPVAIHNAKDGDALFNNICRLVSYIVDHTKYQIALFPHVVFPRNDDREILSMIQHKCQISNRIIMIPDCNCMELKGLISKCSLFIGARTHATIAAYSSFVPTTVLGYSVKARGIAEDLFGTSEQYVLPVQELTSANTLIDNFQWLLEQQKEIRKHLQSIMPLYTSKIAAGKTYLEML